MQPLRNLDYALRAQDFHESLRETRVWGPREAYFERTLVTGKAAVLATHLRGLLYVEDYTTLKFAAGELGIGAAELPAVLRELEAVDFVRIVPSLDQFRRLDIRVPELRNGYEDLGEHWLTAGPSEIERASVETLHHLTRGPIRENDLRQSLGLSEAEYSIVFDVMQSGQLISVQTVAGEKLAYTPLAVDTNPTDYLRWASKFPSDVSNALNILMEHQGLPVSDPLVSQNPTLEDAMMTGVLMPVHVLGATGDQRFLFAPRGGLPAEERVILDKARAILACVRYGQRFASGRPIKNPRRILEWLRDQKRFRQGHPDLHSQYSLLVEKFIGRVINEGNGRWNFEIADTPDNMKALEIAIDMLEIGETPAATIDLAARRAFLNPSGYLGPISTRPRLAKTVKGSPTTRSEIIARLSEIGRGMSI